MQFIIANYNHHVCIDLYIVNDILYDGTHFKIHPFFQKKRPCYPSYGQKEAPKIDS